MNKLVKSINLSKERWLATRPTDTFVDPYKSILRLYLKKIEDIDNRIDIIN
ncbi:MAG: hypothetical protein M1542_08330 [Thermotogae bacterium]|jgi:hypothetical protein|nr:hypothetical protein [Thermotogota bacterium]MCL5033234.1 hypothetical protein [Thermotogota bacterium]